MQIPFVFILGHIPRHLTEYTRMCDTLHLDFSELLLPALFPAILCGKDVPRHFITIIISIVIDRSLWPAQNMS